MAFVLIRHKVRDFEAWKLGYDAHRAKRVEAGLTERHLLRNADNGNEVVLLFEARDLGAARAFSASPNLRETMQAAGVVDRPDIYFLDA
ncbi:MAG: hypothetical protein KGL78_12985 [Burkholderiales bacterium]|nr:hypothetical protein [Burkholderiales bacterium]